MKYNRNLFSILSILLLINFGCSQHHFVKQEELIDEISKLPSGSEIIICDTTNTKYKGYLVNLINLYSDSTHILEIETIKGVEKYRFNTSSMVSRNNVKKIIIPNKSKSSEILIGGLSGMVGGAVAGIFIGNAVKGKYDDTLVPRFLGGIIGSISGFITGAVIVEITTNEDVFILKDNK